MESLGLLAMASHRHPLKQSSTLTSTRIGRTGLSCLLHGQCLPAGPPVWTLSSTGEGLLFKGNKAIPHLGYCFFHSRALHLIPLIRVFLQHPVGQGNPHLRNSVCVGRTKEEGELGSR